MFYSYKNQSTAIAVVTLTVTATTKAHPKTKAITTNAVQVTASGSQLNYTLLL